MKKCVNCLKVWADEDVKVYGTKAVTWHDDKVLHEGYKITDEVIRECCPECGGIVE